MAAGHAGLTMVYTPEIAERHTARGDELREELNRVLGAALAPFQATGVGSLLAVHVTGEGDPRVLELLFLDLLDAGYYIAPRGYMALSLALSSAQLAAFVAAVEQIVRSRAPLWTAT